MKKNVKKIFKASTLLSLALIIAFVSCTKKNETKTYKIQGKEVVEELLPKTMSELYLKVNKTHIVFDTCEVVKQENGYTIVVAKAQNGEEHIHFATLVDGPDGNGEKTGDDPITTCTCTSNCNAGCTPEYHEKLGWICTDCTYVQGDLIPTCVKTVTTTVPSGGNQ